MSSNELVLNVKHENPSTRTFRQGLYIDGAKNARD
jgi:hypothetical protein